MCKCLYRKTSGFLHSLFGSSKDSGFIESQRKRQRKSQTDLDFDHQSKENVAASSSRYSLSRSSSQASVCSCMACSHSGEWKRRPSRLLEGYDVEDFYRFDAVLGRLTAKVLQYSCKSLICIPLSLTQVGLVRELHLDSLGKFGQ